MNCPITYKSDLYQLTQEHDWTASGNGTWSYLYTDINRDYLGHPRGIRQREGTKALHDDYYMQLNNGVIEYKTERPPAPSIAAKEERTISLNQLPNSTLATCERALSFTAAWRSFSLM